MIYLIIILEDRKELELFGRYDNLTTEPYVTTSFLNLTLGFSFKLLSTKKKAATLRSPQTRHKYTMKKEA